jgi:large subunit ribosomal protein L18
MAFNKIVRRAKIKRSIRKDIKGTAEKPRFSVFRSNKGIYAQLIDDISGKTLVATSSLDKEIAENKVNKTDVAKLVGKKIAQLALGQNIETVVFDRNGYLYHGRVKALADSAREGGLKF